MRKMWFLFVLLGLCVNAHAQYNVKFWVPDPVPATQVSYDTDKPLLIDVKGVRVCPDGATMYIGATAPADKKPGIPDFEYFTIAPQKGRFTSPIGGQYLIAACAIITPENPPKK